MIDANLSEKYCITPFGRKGMQILDDGRLVRIFNAKPTPGENWQDALDYAKRRECERDEIPEQAML